ncbi:MAG TPA: carotenoid 1,2-hydratase [Steroidobacteraceae bacterium]|nr:carotenoid 1,2-hydratase [Steroidobacteraceae bacterium]
MRGIAQTLLALMLVMSAAPSVGAPEFPAVVPDYAIELPRDEGSHPQFRTEWWYLTGWVESEGGEPFGFQVTFFRNRPGVDEDNPSRFVARQVLFAHLTVSDQRHGALMRAEKSARAGFGLAEATEGSLGVKIDDWSLRQDGERYFAVASTSEFALQLECTRAQPPLLNGQNGFSQKGPQQEFASYYYSLPQLRTSGRITIGGREHRVHGVAWFDHEWSSRMLDEHARGWDWIGLNLDGGGALMVQRIRADADQQYWDSATLREPGAPDRTYAPDEIAWSPLRRWRSPRTGVTYPVEWKITVGGRTILLRPLLDDQENDARASTGTLYWEGAVRAFDERGRAIGRGYLELTGYGERLRL